MLRLKDAGKTIVFVTHDMKMVLSWCDQAVLLHGSKIVTQGAVGPVVEAFEDLMDHHEKVAVKKFTQGTVEQ